jgi:hypothetical protein
MLDEREGTRFLVGDQNLLVVPIPASMVPQFIQARLVAF